MLESYQQQQQQSHDPNHHPLATTPPPVAALLSTTSSDAMKQPISSLLPSSKSHRRANSDGGATRRFSWQSSSIRATSGKTGSKLQPITSNKELNQLLPGSQPYVLNRTGNTTPNPPPPQHRKRSFFGWTDSTTPTSTIARKGKVAGTVEHNNNNYNSIVPSSSTTNRQRTHSGSAIIVSTTNPFHNNISANNSNSNVTTSRRPPVGGSSSSVGGGGQQQHTNHTTHNVTNKKPTHRRGSSWRSSSGNVSYAGTETSMMSIVSDIRKSTFYRGTNERTGKVLMHFPTSNVHLIPLQIVDRDNPVTAEETTEYRHSYGINPNLPEYTLQVGHIYQVPDHPDMYEEYHRIAEEGGGGFGFSWIDDDYDVDQMNDDDDSFMSDVGIYYGTPRRKPNSTTSITYHPSGRPPPQNPGRADNYCHCTCPNCTTCVHRSSHSGASLLGQSTGTYCLAVEDTIYRRVLDEVCASQSMPFGLFFCGHHEDVSRPSITIAIAIVFVLLGTLGTIANYFQN